MRARSRTSVGVTSYADAETGPALVVRYVPEVHAEGLIDVLGAMHLEQYPGPAAGASRESWASWLERIDMFERFVAVSPAGAVVGHVGLARGNANAVLAQAPPEAAEIVRLFVHPLWRGAGVGGDLLSRATQSATSLCPSAVLLVSD